jgi:Rieske Fe-S protein
MGAAALAAGGAIGGLAAGCGSPSARHLVDGGPGTQLVLPLAEFPTLKTVGGAATAAAGAGGEEIVVFRRSETEVVAVSPICPHQQCGVNYTGDMEGPCFVCPCHGSAFGAEGELLRGPATRGLTRFSAVLEQERVVITL